MNAEVFAKGLEKCRLLTRILEQNVENLDHYVTMVAQNFQSLLEKEKRTFRGSALVSLPDTKQGFNVPRGKQKCMANGLCNISKFLYVFSVFVFTTNLTLSTRHDFFLEHSFREIELTKQMTDHEDNNNLGKILFDDSNQERKSWACLRQNCSRSLIVFLSHLFVNLLIIFGCFGEFFFQKLVTNQLFVLEFWAVWQDNFYPH